MTKLEHAQTNTSFGQKMSAVCKHCDIGPLIENYGDIIYGTDSTWPFQFSISKVLDKCFWLPVFKGLAFSKGPQWGSN